MTFRGTAPPLQQALVRTPLTPLLLGAKGKLIVLALASTVVVSQALSRHHADLSPQPAPSPTQTPSISISPAQKLAEPPTTPRPHDQTAAFQPQPRKPNPSIQLQRHLSPLGSALESGRTALSQGQYPQAQTAYTQALQLAPKNLEACLTLAQLAQKEGLTQVALTHYQKALRAHPGNGLALAGYLDTADQVPQDQKERLLKTLTAREKHAPALHFALGNLLAAQKRWPEAQAAYFQAYALDSTNPDYRFNLAVALDQLGQSSLAITQYRLALEAAQERPTNFDPQSAQQRLLALEGKSHP